MQAFKCGGYDVFYCVGSVDYEKCEKVLFSKTAHKGQPQRYYPVVDAKRFVCVFSPLKQIFVRPIFSFRML